MKSNQHEPIEPCNKQCSFCFLQFTNVLSAENLFLGLTENEIGEIIQSVHHRVRNYSRGEILIHEDEKYNSLIFLLQGKISTQIMNIEGQVLIIDQLQAPAALAPAALFSTDDKISVTAIADEDCRTLILPRESVKQIIETNQQIMTNFFNILSNRVQFLTKKMKMMRFENLRSKFIKHIRELGEAQNSNEIRLQHTQQELSEIFGVARPSLARVIRDLHNEGIIHAKGKAITLLHTEQ